MANHSAASRELLVEVGMKNHIAPAAIKEQSRAMFGCGVGELTDAQMAELAASLPALAHTSALHQLTGMGVSGPGGMYKPDAEPAKPGQRCVQCGRPGMWISGAGRVLCHTHQDNY